MSVYTIPKGLGNPVTYRTYSWLQMVEKAWGAEYKQPDHRIYQFSDGRAFDSTDMYQTGIYKRGIKSWTADSMSITADSGLRPFDTQP